MKIYNILESRDSVSTVEPASAQGSYKLPHGAEILEEARDLHLPWAKREMRGPLAEPVAYLLRSFSSSGRTRKSIQGWVWRLSAHSEGSSLILPSSLPLI